MKHVAFLIAMGALTLSTPAHSKTFCGSYKSDSPCQDVSEGSECATDAGTFGACFPQKMYGDKASCKCVQKFERVVEYGKSGPIESTMKCNRDDSADGCQGVPLDSNCIVDEGEGICVPSKLNSRDITCACVDKPEEKVLKAIELDALVSKRQ